MKASTEERLRSVIDHVVDGIITLDARGTIAHFNPAAQRIFGYAEQEVIGQNVKILMPEPYRSEHDDYIANYLRTGKAKIIGIGRELVGQRKDGTTFPMELAISEFKLREGRYFTGIVRDISERKRSESEGKRAEEKLRSSEERQRLALEAGELGTWVNDLETGSVFLDQRAMELYGTPFSGMSEAAFFERVHPEDRARIRAETARQGSLEEAQRERLEYRIVTPEGRVKWIEAYGYVPLHGDSHRAARIVGVCRDITERKRTEAQLKRAAEEMREAEERMRSVLDNVLDGIITIDETGRIQSYNPAAEKIFGYTRDEVFGQNVKLLMAEPYYSEHDAYVANYLRTGKPKIIGIGREVLGKRKDGSTFPMDLGVSEFHIDARRYFTGIVRDITERKRLEDRLRQQVEELAEADRQKNEFLAMLGHELRNPLGPMSNALYLMKRAHSDTALLDEAHGMIERQLQHLVRLVDDLLDVSRIIRGKIDLRRERLDLRQVIRRAAETAKPVIDANAHELEMAMPAKPVYVMGDLIRLAQVISNLLTNAAKYSTKPGSIGLTLTQEASQAVLVVKDQGVGIPAELLPHVFDLFVQGEHTLARSQGGLGIGLTLVRRLVEMHKGQVSAASKGRNQGSEFTVRLPALAGSASVPEGARPEVAASGPLRRVLVVDDNVDAANSIAKVLELFGHKVHCAYDGPTALSAAEAFRPDVIVLDIGLPGMDGYEVAKRLRATPAFEWTPIVAVTGYGQEEDRARARKAGFDRHLTKPVDPEVLHDFVVASGD